MQAVTERGEILATVYNLITDIAEHICQIKRKSDGNFFLKRANGHFLVSGHSS